MTRLSVCDENIDVDKNRIHTYCVNNHSSAKSKQNFYPPLQQKGLFPTSRNNSGIINNNKQKNIYMYSIKIAEELESSTLSV